ncbi:MAG: GTP-binding protein, partial [Ruthenibacterium sp.]
MELYCITGFLGAGKTTFLKNFIRLFEHRKIFLLINEFGKVGVDASLLRAMHATLAEINNGSIFCACRLD